MTGCHDAMELCFPGSWLQRTLAPIRALCLSPTATGNPEPRAALTLPEVSPRDAFHWLLPLRMKLFNRKSFGADSAKWTVLRTWQSPRLTVSLATRHPFVSSIRSLQLLRDQAHPPPTAHPPLCSQVGHNP